MKLNPDCIRDLMLRLEKITGTYPDSPYQFREINASSLMHVNEISSKYQYNEVVYTLIQLAESGYISMSFVCDNDRLCLKMGNVLYVTPKGHEFIAAMSNETVWKSHVTPVLKAFGAVSLSIVESVASGATSAFLDHLKAEP